MEDSSCSIILLSFDYCLPHFISPLPSPWSAFRHGFEDFDQMSRSFDSSNPHFEVYFLLLVGTTVLYIVSIQITVSLSLQLSNTLLGDTYVN